MNEYISAHELENIQGLKCDTNEVMNSPEHLLALLGGGGGVWSGLHDKHLDPQTGFNPFNTSLS